ncbi:MAG: hypothetical protein OXC46_07205 [Thaumarchaeota archaeon]|nr:hypothetical protein [Nitrososphaerota archaeon]
MTRKKNEIEGLVDDMIASSDEFVKNLTSVLPESLASSVKMFQESNVSNLKMIKEFLNKP